MSQIHDQEADYPALVNGELVGASEARVPVRDDGFLRGDGAFEVVRVYLGRPFELERHIERLARSCGALRLPFDTAILSSEAKRLVEMWGEQSCDLRIVLTRGGLRLLMLEALRPREDVARLLVVVDQPRPVLEGAKTLSYAANMLAKRIAGEAACTDALLVTPEDRVLESQTAAFFWVDDHGVLSTPPLSDGILDSVTRRVVLSAMGAEERSCSVEEALRCQEAFLAGTTKEVQPIASIGEWMLPQCPGVKTKEATEAFWRVVGNQTGVRTGAYRQDLAPPTADQGMSD
jgi:branched-chain amino acid aminotransferase